MASFSNHELTGQFGYIERFDVRQTAVPGKENTIVFDSVENTGDGYDITFTIDNLSEYVKENLRNHSGRFVLEVGRMNRAGTSAIASYQTCKQKKYTSAKTHPNHHFKRTASFQFTIASSNLNKPNTFSIHLYEDELIGYDNGEEFYYRYKSRSKAQTWEYLIFRIKMRIVINVSDLESPYRLNSDEIVAYCSYT